jgi:LysM repeat protein
MGISIDGIMSSARDRAGDIIDQGQQFAREVANAGGRVVETGRKAAAAVTHGAITTGRDTSGAAVERISEALPDGTVTSGLGIVEVGIDIATAPLRPLAPDNEVADPNLPQRVGRLANSLSNIDFESWTDSEDLQGDWGRLWQDWFFERRPEALGEWSTVVDDDGQIYDKVVITETSYTQDLAEREFQQSLTTKFFETYTNPEVGDAFGPSWWVYTGPGTSEDGSPPSLDESKPNPTDGNPTFTGGGGVFSAVEGFLGSYRTAIEVVHVDPATGNVTLEYTVRNDSDWDSATRVPATGQAVGFPDHLLPNQNPDSGLHVGGNFRQEYRWQRTFTSDGQPIPGTHTAPVEYAAPVPADGLAQTPETDDTPPPSGDVGGDSPSQYVEHVVQPGDSIWDIAETYGVSFQETLELNQGRFSDPDLIYPGEIVYVPVAASEAPQASTPQQSSSNLAE